MFILALGMLGVVALPFLILMMPVILWLALPTAVVFGAGFALRSMKRRNAGSGLLLPLQRS